MQNKKIILSLAKMTGYEMDFIREAFETNWVVPLGPNVNGFENDLAKYLGENRQVVALSSGTAALHLALIQLGVKPGNTPKPLFRCTCTVCPPKWTRF